jgi:tRNA 2-thiouridine synthesizing protein B
MGTLHLLSHSPFTDSRLKSCLQLLDPGDGLLLTGDAVYALQPDSLPLLELLQLPGDMSIFVLQEDASARGLTTLAHRVRAIDYATFVELCTTYARVNSWL